LRNLPAGSEVLGPTGALGVGEVAEELALVGPAERGEHAVEVAAGDLLGRDATADEVPLLLAATPELPGHGVDAPDLLVRVAFLVALGVAGQELLQGQATQLLAIRLLRRREAEVEHGLSYAARCSSAVGISRASSRWRACSSTRIVKACLRHWGLRSAGPSLR
jgi:hypothetical protein